MQQSISKTDENKKTLSASTSETENVGKENVDITSNIDAKNVKEERADGNDANIQWKEVNRKLEIELHAVQEKLKRKQECLVQVQQEKENQYTAMR